jgi:hypothetical protein
MQFDLPALLNRARATVQDPRAGARRILALNLPLNVAAMALVIIGILTGLLAAVVSMMAASAGAQPAPFVPQTPLQWAVLQTFALFILAGLMAAVGRAFGGIGTFSQAVALLAWAEFIILIVQVAQFAALIVMPPLSAILALVQIGLTFYLIAHFIAEMHGFSSVIKVFFGILGTGFAIVFALSVLVAMIVGA